MLVFYFRFSERPNFVENVALRSLGGGLGEDMKNARHTR